MESKKKIMAMILDDFECLKLDIDSLKKYYNEQAKNFIDKDDDDGLKDCMGKRKDINRFMSKIDDMLEEFDSIIAEEIEDIGTLQSNDTDNGFAEIRNFTFTTPLQMKMLDKIYDINGNWRDLLVIVCEELIRKRPDRFKNFDKNPVFQGRKRVYFSYDPKNLTYNHRKLSNGLYVELNLSANDIVKRCRDILEQCDYNPDDIYFKVEWNKDDKLFEGGKTESKIVKTDNEIMFPREYGSLHISKVLFTKVIDEILKYQIKYNSDFINPMRIKDILNDIILDESNYSVPYHVIGNIFKFLTDEGLLDNYPGTKKGKYIIKDEKGIENFVAKFSD